MFNCGRNTTRTSQRFHFIVFPANSANCSLGFLNEKQMTAVTSDFAAQHFKTLECYFIHVESGGLFDISASVSHQPPPHFPSLPSTSPLSALRPCSVTLADCVMRTSTRAQINFDLLIPFEQKKRERRLRRRRRGIKEASQVAV